MDLASLQLAMEQFLRGYPGNDLGDGSGAPIYAGPLLAAADPDDPLFAELIKADVVGPDHLSPRQWLPGARSVVCYFLPYSEEVRCGNRPGKEPSPEWLRGRWEGEQVNNAVRHWLLTLATALGEAAVVPSLDPRHTTAKRRSNWSERHAAFIAGLGTFSLSKSLITRRGSAGRLGSVIWTIPLKPTVRDYADREEWCTMCGACMKRCPAGAILPTGKEHGPCSDFIDETRVRYAPRYGCGKCQTGVPCESKKPGKIRHRR
jgi:epoxyqueuosine reductase QueG